MAASSSETALAVVISTTTVKIEPTDVASSAARFDLACAADSPQGAPEPKRQRAERSRSPAPPPLQIDTVMAEMAEDI